MLVMSPRHLVIFLLLTAIQEGFLRAGFNVADAKSVTDTARQKIIRSSDEALEAYDMCVNIFGSAFADSTTALYVLHGIELSSDGWKLNGSLIGSGRITKQEMSSKITTMYSLCRTLEKCLKENRMDRGESICRSANLLKQIREVTAGSDIRGTFSSMNEQSAGTSNSTGPITALQLSETLSPKIKCLWTVIVGILVLNVTVFLLIIMWKMGRRFLPCSYVLLLISFVSMLMVYHYCIINNSKISKILALIKK